MSSPLATWLNQLPTLPGLLGACVRLGDRQNVLQSFSANCPEAFITLAASALTEAAAAQTLASAPPHRHRWTFQHLVVDGMLRPDGTWLLLFWRPGTAAEASQDTMESFLAQPGRLAAN